MEKLIEYYNEYYQKENLKEYYDYIKDMVLPEKFDSLIFLKDFCKWLVDNDKIDQKKVNFWDSIIYCVYEYYPKISVEDELLMMLSISSSPIEDLISYLK